MPSSFRIFLASSSELAAERAAIEIRINRINKAWQAQGIFLHLEIWEDFLDTVSRTRKQDDYNAALRQCDLFVVLVHHRLGKYSAEEFEAAYSAFQDHGRPLILVYLKDPPGPRDPDPSPEYVTVRAFRRRLGEIDHFPTPYESVSELLDHLARQLERLRDSGQLGGAGPSTPPLTPSGPVPGLHGGGAQAVGAKSQAASSRGVNIAGNNSGEVRTGDTRIHTGGGAYFAGKVSVKNGNLVGRDHHETHVHAPADTEAPASELIQALSSLREAIEGHASPANRPLATEMLDELAAESAKPTPERNDGRMARLVDGLVDLVPAGAKAVAATLLGPVLGGLAGPLTEAVLDKLRGKSVP